MKSSRRLNRRRRERCHLLVLKFYSLSFSVFLRLSVFLAVRSLLRALSLSLSLKLFLLPVVSKTPTSLRNLSEKTRERTKTTEDTKKFCLLLFALRQTDKKEGKKVAHLSPFLRARERLLERSRGKKSFALFLSLCVYIYRAHTASSS